MGVGHRITMISNIAKYLSILRDQDHFVRQLKIASSRDYDLIFVYFAKILRMRNMTIFLYKATKWRNPKDACVQVYYFHSLILGFLFDLFLSFHSNPNY